MDNLDAGGHRLHAGLVERQPVEHGPGQAAGARLGDILGIGGQDRRLGPPNGRRHGLKRLILLVRRRERQHPGGRTGTAADLGHGGGDIAGSLDAFQRRGHGRKRPVSPIISVVFLSRRGRGGEIGRPGPGVPSYLGIAWITGQAVKPNN